MCEIKWVFEQPGKKVKFCDYKLSISLILSKSLGSFTLLNLVCAEAQSTELRSSSSFKLEPLQLHRQWEMDLIAREQLVSSRKNPHVRRRFFATHLWIPWVLRREIYWKDWKTPVSCWWFIAYSWCRCVLWRWFQSRRLLRMDVGDRTDVWRLLLRFIDTNYSAVPHVSGKDPCFMQDDTAVLSRSEPAHDTSCSVKRED